MPYVLSPVKNCAHLNKVSASSATTSWYERLLATAATRTFFINSEEDYKKYAEETGGREGAQGEEAHQPSRRRDGGLR
ncbi:MAG: hypothetical protein IPI05_06770 [Flavobacteriales bacterium]|nr:hypothetical protein [Flavobacteriales bacterium]